MVADALANTTRAAHDVGLAAWLGGSMFGKFALSPSLEKVASHTERGSLSNAAWNGYNVINTIGLGAAAVGWGAARLTETRPDKLSGRERALSRAKDGLLGAALLTGVASGVQGLRLAKQAPDGAVAVKTSRPHALDQTDAPRVARPVPTASTATLGWAELEAEAARQGCSAADIFFDRAGRRIHGLPALPGAPAMRDPGPARNTRAVRAPTPPASNFKTLSRRT